MKNYPTSTFSCQLATSWSMASFREGKRKRSYSTLSVMRVLSFIVAVSAKPLVAGDDMWDCRTVSNASRTSFSLT